MLRELTYVFCAVANLAVRTVGGTTVLRQTRLRSPPVGQSQPFAAKRLVDVEAGGSVHAHVEFNPWYERQFAIIDESGKWRIWDIEGRQARDSRMRRDLALEGYASGHISTPGDETGKGWGRIMWGGDLNTIMACDRKRAGLFDIRVRETPPDPNTTNTSPEPPIRQAQHPNPHQSWLGP